MKFGRAIDKYGWDAFDHEIVYSNISENEAKKLERELIENLKTQDDRYGYNITGGGEGVLGFKHTDESKKIMSAKKSGNKHPNYHNHLSAATREKISSHLLGNKNALRSIRSNETKERISASKKKPVNMYDRDLLIKIFDSAIDAQQATGISRKTYHSVVSDIGNRRADIAGNLHNNSKHHG